LGFDLVEVDGWITDEAIAEVRRLLDDPDRRHQMVATNYQLAQRYFSYDTLARALEQLLADLTVD